MKKPRSSRRRDRLSELPESLIFRIFWLLPMRDVVTTTILSKRWKNLWTTTPCLNFDYDDDMYAYDETNTFGDFVNRALISWEGTTIQKFKINFQAGELVYRDYDFWVNFALRKKVQELYVDSPCDSFGYSVPQNVYACSSLKVLSLEECRLEIKGNVQWNQLKSLTIRSSMVKDDEINQVLSGSPQLEVFDFTHKESCENLSFRSSSLKWLSIYHEGRYYSDLLGRELRIWTPNLETLKISGTPYRKCLLMDVSSLTHAMLCFRCGHLPLDGIDLLLETLEQVLPTIQHVENVTVPDCCIKVLGDMIKKGSLPLSWNAKFLKLKNCCAIYEQIVGVLEVFPRLEMLVLKGDMRFNYNHHVQKSLKFDANLSKSFLLHLRTIKITWAEGVNSIFPFIKIVLEHASKLEKMVIRVAPPEPQSKSLVLALQKLLRMPRSSPTAELIFL